MKTYIFFLSALLTVPSFADVWTYNIPGGAVFSSPDYKVSIEQNGIIYPSFVHCSIPLSQYQKYNVQGGNLVPDGEPVTPALRGTARHSTAIFSFSGTIHITVTIKKNAKHISLPLRSAKILPSSYNIPCQIINDSTITFTLDRPEKVVLMANYDEAWNVFEQRAVGHIPIQTWKSNYNTEINKTTYHGNNLLQSLIECYKNPLFIITLPPESNIPVKTAPNTLVVNPGDPVTQAQINQHQTVWFAPGIHDLSRMGTAPRYQVIVNPGQTIYLEGGSYVYARFAKTNTSGKASLTGRGMVSGAKHHWATSLGGHINGIDTIIGITLTDREAFGIEHGHYIKDVALVGAWHGNTDGIDFSDDCEILNCFSQAHDDNLKLNNNTHIKHAVTWQMENAHSVMVKEMRNDVTFSNCIVEDIDILTNLRPIYNSGWDRLNGSCLASCNGRNITINNFIYRDIRIESPYITRVFSFFNLDTNQPYAASWLANAPSSEARHTRINGITFENITVNSPLILERSLLGSDYLNSMSNLHFTNLMINGNLVTNQNRDEFFEIEYDKINGLYFQDEEVGVIDIESDAYSVYPNPANDFLTLVTGQNLISRHAYNLVDFNGKVLETKTISDIETIIETEHLSPGIYFLMLTDNRHQKQYFKIIKIYQP